MPAGLNPLTGLPVTGPGALELPAVLISITNFPVSARPQAGLSFAPWIYEIYIAEGTTRFLATFYGDFPRYDFAVQGNCAARVDPFVKSGTLIGNWVWIDYNNDGMQSPLEPGVGGVCVRLVDAVTGQMIEQTSTDSNGFYGFNVAGAGQYQIEFTLPENTAFTLNDIGNDDQDSDVDPATARTPVFDLAADDLSWDAGLKLIFPSLGATVTPTPASGKNPQPVLPQVGPIRSGRMPYVHIRDMFPDSCLVYAGATKEIREMLRGCAIVFGSDTTDINSAFIDATKIQQIAERNKTPGREFNYASNAFTDIAPAGGTDARELKIFYSFLNQADWQFDPLSGAYLRFEDKADGSGRFYPATDRLNGRQLAFSNVIVLIANHTVVAPAIIDIDLSIGAKGYAYAFRDGQMYKIMWTTEANAYEKSTGLRRPMRFINMDGTPYPLKPGQTWMHVMTPFSYIEEKSPGVWQARFIAPKGAR